MKVLIIEDDVNKLHAIMDYICETGITGIGTKTSFHSGLKELVDNKYDLVLLDMSMPVYDITVHDNGGRPLPLAGRDILYNMHRRQIDCKAIVITQYEDFGGIPLTELDEDLRTSFPRHYLGVVYYNTMQAGWKSKLSELLSKYCEVKND